MKTDLHQATVKLRPEHPHALRSGKGTLVYVMWGVVWITEENNAEDYILGAGESHRIGSDGLTVIHALDAASLSLLEPCAHQDTGEIERNLREARRGASVPTFQGYLPLGIVPHYRQQATRLHDEALQSAVEASLAGLAGGARALWKAIGDAGMRVIRAVRSRPQDRLHWS